MRQFSNESFHFDLSSILGYSVDLHVNGWRSERPLHWMSVQNEEPLAEGRFLETPGLPLLFLTDLSGRCLSDDIPKEVLATCEVAAWMQFEMAQACALSRNARELAKDVPLLLIFLIEALKNKKPGPEKLDLLSRSKRKTILEFAGLPGNNSLVQLLRRIGLRPITPWELNDVADVLSDENVLKLLRHHPTPHLNHLMLLKRHRGHRWAGMMYLVDAQSHSQDVHWVCRLTNDVERLCQGNLRHLEGVQTKEQLQVLHDQLVALFNKKQGKNSEAYRRAQADELQKCHGTYPQPPIPENVRIKALTSWRSLLDEGQTMHHCVGVYDSMVAEGEVFIYQMHEPERLTISLESTETGWVIGEVRGYCNVNPSHHALELIHRWINSDQSSLQRTKSYSSQ